MLLHYLRKLKIQIFYRYSADIEENANKLHFEYTDFNSPTRTTVYSECIYVFYQHLVLVAECMLIVDKHRCDVCCDEFPVPQIGRNVKQVKNSDVENFICNQYGEKLAILNPENIKICG